MKTVILLSSLYSIKGSPLLYKEYYEKLIKIWLDKWIKIIRTCIYEYDLQKKIFTNWEYFDWKRWSDVKNIKPDLIWYKSNDVKYLTNIIENNHNMINDTNFIQLVNDKFYTSIYFSDYSPKSYQINMLNNNNLLKDFQSNQLILKPNWWSWWKGIIKIEKSDLDKYINKDDFKNYLVQDFIDLSKWIPNIIKWIHDIRVVIFGGKIWDYVLIRTPAKNDFRCNLSSGWSGKYVNIDCFDNNFKNIITYILDKILNEFWFIFWTIDLARWDDGKYYLIELNSSAWIALYWLNDKISDNYFNLIIDMFKVKIK